MNKKIKLDLFVRLMRSPSHRRTDVLEFMGSTDVALDDLFEESGENCVSGTTGGDIFALPDPSLQRS